MSAHATPHYVRLQVELVLEVADPDGLGRAAAEHVAADEFMPDEERRDATAAVRADTAEAIAYLVDPIDMVSALPGVELAQASWSSERADYDPESDLWQLDAFTADAAGDGDDSGGDSGGDSGDGESGGAAVTPVR
ncbi:hypothetical protein V1J52_06510 [Streptomyces sp. TRM 70351]|uniref:hypothetical protein n=1 Tax=Streptomyces sp. TRM 70351 TaxID=3116552 RepID=UPI002E7C3F27|nr:hypothetical protein [Streptomyces sp. TRM 70351]MEE1927845.1 hypothetical protein [Streptomyces sp. TRM 70351]